MTAACAALILAGGRSERMGQPKAWLPIDGVPALRHITDLALQACPVVLVASARAQSLPPLDPRVLRADDPKSRSFEGPLSGITNGLGVLTAQNIDLAYIGACDSVFLSKAHIDRMLAELEGDLDHGAVVPCSVDADSGRTFVHPTCGAVRVDAAHRAGLALLAAGTRAARQLYKRLGARAIAAQDLPEPRIIRSCNTPEQWRAAVAEYAAERGNPPRATPRNNHDPSVVPRG